MVLLDALPDLEPGERVLVIGDQAGMVGPELSRRGLVVSAWQRFAHGSREGSPWPEGGPYDAATLRLPRSKAALDMALHAAAAHLKADAPLWVYGANDEGIKSVSTRIEPLLGDTETLDTRKHCRVVEAIRPAQIEGLKVSLAEFRQEQALTLVLPGRTEDLTRTFVSYPGMFAKGGLDDGTRLLLSVLPTLKAGARVLDFACGAGVIAAAVQHRQPDAEVWLTDADAVSVAAARENVPSAQVLCGDGWARIPAVRHFHAIFSNPPIHAGKGRSYDVLQDLIQGAPARLRDNGQLWLVTQRQVPVQETLEATFHQVRLAAEDPRYRVWCAESAKSPRRT